MEQVAWLRQQVHVGYEEERDVDPLGDQLCEEQNGQFLPPQPPVMHAHVLVSHP